MAKTDTRGPTGRDERLAGRALAVVPPVRPALAEEVRSAGFVTQLIACRDGLPAYRRARRAEPGIASDSYGRPHRPAPRRLDLSV